VSEAAHSILASIVSDFEECNELGWKTAPQRTIHVFCSEPHPNPIIATPVVPKVESPRASQTVDVVYFRFLERKNWNFLLCQ